MESKNKLIENTSDVWLLEQKAKVRCKVEGWKN